MVRGGILTSQVGPQAPPVAAVETVARQTWHAEAQPTTDMGNLRNILGKP